MIYFCLQINDVLKCEQVIRHFAKEERMCQLLLKKWPVLLELNQVLHVPYLATQVLQKADFTLSDFFGCLKVITMQLDKIIAQPGQRLSRLAEKLSLTLSQRKSKLIDHPLMICALYLDPRYKCEIIHNRDKVQLAKLTLENIWERVRRVRNEMDDTSADSPAECIPKKTMKNFLDELDELYDNMGLNHGNGSNSFASSTGNANQDKSKIAIALSKYDSCTVERMKSSESVWSFWEKSKEDLGSELYELASIIHSIPPTQASVERNFSALKFMLTERRFNLSEDLLESLLVIHLNRDFYETVKNVEIQKLI